MFPFSHIGLSQVDAILNFTKNETKAVRDTLTIITTTWTVQFYGVLVLQQNHKVKEIAALTSKYKSNQEMDLYSFITCGKQVMHMFQGLPNTLERNTQHKANSREPDSNNHLRETIKHCTHMPVGQKHHIS